MFTSNNEALQRPFERFFSLLFINDQARISNISNVGYLILQNYSIDFSSSNGQFLNVQLLNQILVRLMIIC